MFSQYCILAALCIGAVVCHDRSYSLEYIKPHYKQLHDDYIIGTIPAAPQHHYERHEERHEERHGKRVEERHAGRHEGRHEEKHAGRHEERRERRREEDSFSETERFPSYHTVRRGSGHPSYSESIEIRDHIGRSHHAPAPVRTAHKSSYSEHKVLEDRRDRRPQPVNINNYFGFQDESSSSSYSELETDGSLFMNNFFAQSDGSFGAFKRLFGADDYSSDFSEVVNTARFQPAMSFQNYMNQYQISESEEQQGEFYQVASGSFDK